MVIYICSNPQIDRTVGKVEMTSKTSSNYHPGNTISAFFLGGLYTNGICIYIYT